MIEEQKDSSFKASVGTSTKKNAYESGKEVAEKTLKKLGCKPDFVLLFCSEDYENNGGIKNFLKAVHEKLSNEIVVIGGTINGFLTNEGCFARGAVALAVSYPNMNISIGYGKNTKRNPKKAAKNCLKQIKSNLSNKYKHKILFTFISSTKNVKIPGVKDTSLITSKMLAKISLLFLSFFQKINKGFGREMKVIQQIIKELPDYDLIHGSMTCGAPYPRNFQFFNKKIFKDSVITLALETDIPFNLNITTGTKQTDRKMKISKISKDKKIIKEINNKPALPEFLRLMKWSEKDIYDQKWTDIGVRYPVTYKKNDKIINRPHLLLLGDYLGVVAEIEEETVFIGNLESKNIINSTNDVLKSNNPSLGFFPACFSMRDFLGIKVFEIQKILNDYFNDIPYLLMFVGGEAIYKPNEGFYYNTESLTSVIFHKIEKQA